MHAWYEKYEMTCYAQKCLINHASLPKYTQKFWRQGKHISNLIRFFIFLIFYFWSGTLSRSSFIQTTICRKKTFIFLIIFSAVFFLTTAFYSRHVSFFFFCQFSFNTQKIFFSEGPRFLFFRLLFKIKQHPTSRKEIEWETIFFCIFVSSKIENTSFCFDKSQIFEF